MKKSAIVQNLFLTLVLTIGGAVLCMAQTGVPEIKLPEKVSPQTQVTYLDLLKKVFTDARTDEQRAELARATNKIPLRNLFGQELDKFFNAQMTGELEIAVTARVEIANGREKLLLLLIGVNNKGEDCEICGNTLLAAYRVRKTDAELIDAAAVKTAARTSFDETPKLRLSPASEAVVIFNDETTNIATNTYSIVAVDEKGFKVLIKEFDEGFVSKCGYFITEAARFKILKTAVGGFPQIEVLVKTESGWDGNGDGERIEKRRSFRYVYSWQPRAGQYRAVINPERQRGAFFKKHSPCME